ncbi:unnamed protein product [Moneuplotes crassus]|uniref:Uncharacterized protein n=1 Tax=Euplotes crassus TaxID=5936 RepID=A0AAD1XRI8_EUPCR|nr:unnamed protein product [Moneuplotes crassus]
MLKPLLCLAVILTLSICYNHPYRQIQQRLYRGSQGSHRRDSDSFQNRYQPHQKSSNSIDVKTKKKQEKNNFIKPYPLPRKSEDECFNLSYPEETGEDLKEILESENKNIVVTVWYENFQNEWAQNMVNQDVQGTLWRCLCENHPDIIYSEADISHYNLNAYTYIDLAKELEIELGELNDGPTIVVMSNHTGMTFRTEENPLKLLKATEKYIRQIEKELYGLENPYCDLKHQILADNHYEYYDPIEMLQMYRPHKEETAKKVGKKQSKSPNYQLSEPEKAFS